MNQDICEMGSTVYTPCPRRLKNSPSPFVDETTKAGALFSTYYSYSVWPELESASAQCSTEPISAALLWLSTSIEVHVFNLGKQLISNSST